MTNLYQALFPPICPFRRDFVGKLEQFGGTVQGLRGRAITGFESLRY